VGQHRITQGFGVSFCFFCKKYDKPAAEASRKARKNYGQRVGYGVLKY